MDDLTVVSVEPAVDFGNGHGTLAVRPVAPGRVVVEQADRVVYVPVQWVDKAAAGGVPWAELDKRHPWTMGAALKIHGTDGNVVYVITGGCGPRVDAYLCEQPD
jgi:hypothetical protein